MKPTVAFRHPDGSLAELENGDFIGRLGSAALVLDDPRVSEAHAMVSLREGDLWLLALRRMFSVGNRPLSEVRLVPGLVVTFADGLDVTVDHLQLPDEVWAIQADGLPRTILPSVCSIRTKPRLSLSARHEPDADVVLWWNGTSWRIRQDGQERTLHAPEELPVGSHRLSILRQPVAGSGPGVTRVQGGVHQPLHLIAAFDTVHLHRDGEPTLVLTGISARIVSELVTLGGPAPWQVIAREIWPDEPDEFSLRKRWDVSVARLRARLRDARVRADLIRADGTGNFEIVAAPGDRVEDRT